MVIERRAWQWLDWVMLGVLTSGLAIGLLYVMTVPQLVGYAERIGFMLALLVCYFTPLLFWHPGYTHLWALPFSVLVTSGFLSLFITYRYGEMTNLVTVALLLLGFHSRGCYILIVNIVLFVLAIPMLQVWIAYPGSFDLALMITFSVNAAIMLGLGLGIHKIWYAHYSVKQLYEENLRVYRLVQEQNRVLEQYSSQVEKLTVAEERNRMSRELHDTVGHTFTTVIMGMDAVSYLLEVNPSMAREKLDVLRQVARDGLEEVRRNIHQMAPPEEESFGAQLEQMAKDFGVNTGTEVHLTTSGEVFELPRQAQLTMIRCLQEALTNSKRHGQASSIRIHAEYAASRYTLTISDDGVGSGSGDIQPGFGLTAMEDRLAALQGKLQVLPSAQKGVTVVCSIPVLRSSGLGG
ncbi:Sensor histidine kinase DesK [compost metagenome]